MFRVLFLLLALLAIAPAHAELCDGEFGRLTPRLERINTRFRAIAEDYQQWLRDHPEASKRQLKRRISIYLEDVSKHLRKHGVEHTVEEGPQGVPRIRILPGEESVFNRYANGIQKYNEVLGVYYDPYQLHREYTGAFYLHSDGIYVSIESMIRGSPGEEGVRHETLHAVHDYYERVGRMGVVNANIWPTKREMDRRSFRMPGPLHGGYGNFVAMDELVTYQGSLRDYANEFVDVLIRGESEELETARKNFQQTLRVSGKIHERIGAVLDHAEAAVKHKRSVRLNRGSNEGTFELDGNKFMVELKAETFASHDGSVRPYVESGEITVREVKETTVDGERPIGFSLSLSLRASVGDDNSRNVLPEIREQLREARDLWKLAREHREEVDALVKKVEAAMEQGRLDDAKVWQARLKRASQIRRPEGLIPPPLLPR